MIKVATKTIDKKTKFNVTFRLVFYIVFVPVCSILSIILLVWSFTAAIAAFCVRVHVHSL